jgi:uncharacterized protein YabN with tetrapyrrole methylase and pyrophosphatase domain
VTPYLVEEAYELVSAIDAGDIPAVGEELGDVLFQVLFVAQLFEERGDLDLSEVAAHNRVKMMRRHPHVFGDETIATAGDVKLRWAEIKAAEKKAQGQGGEASDLPAKLPAILKACRHFDRMPRKPRCSEPLAQAASALRRLEAQIPADDSSPPADPLSVQAAGDALLHLVHAIRRMNQHPETLLNQALQRQLDRDSD